VVESGVDVLDGCRAEEVELGDEEHTVTVSRDGSAVAVRTRWVVDATGRSSLLKGKLGLAQGVGHAVSSAWFCIDGGLDLDSRSDDPDWHARVKERGVRVASTNY